MQHPNNLLDKELVKTIRAAAATAEQAGTLTHEQLDIIYAQRWFNLFVPKEYGGLALSLPEALRLEESFAWIDGSFGWTITLCSGANWFVGFLQPSAAASIFSNAQACLAGSGRPSGIAKMVDDGYEVSGQWDYATGAPHATVFTCNCVIEKDGVTLLNENGEPLTRSFWFTKEEVTIQHNWQSGGMIATASHRFVVNDLKIPADRSFIIDAAHVVLPDPIYQFPFVAFAECTLAVNSSGMAVRFVELFEEIMNRQGKMEKNIFYPVDPSSIVALNTLWNECSKNLDTRRTIFYTTIEHAWQAMISNGKIKEDLLQQIAVTSRDLAFTALQISEQLYPYAGLVASHPGSELNRLWRDLHTGSQHSLLRFPF